jgi:AGCS family alanine or glycine:cation symporter
VLAVKYREVDEQGHYSGGPMYYIKNGLGKRWHGLAIAFALFGAIAAFGIGNMVQANSVASAVDAMFHIPVWQTGVVMTVLTAAVILGGIGRIASVASKLVPTMAVIYIAGALFVIFSYIDQVPSAFSLIISHAFTGTAAAGGFVGAAVWAAVRFGVARGIFSNEAGLGSAPIAHAAAKGTTPVQQGMIAMLGTLIDTLIICTMTALVIILTGAWSSGETGAALSTLAFNIAMPGWGGYIIVFGLVVFAFTTILGWSYYGEKCWQFLFKEKSVVYYRILWVIAAFWFANQKVDFVWNLSDTLNGLMALPNLIGLLILSPMIFRVTREHFERQKNKASVGT